MNIYSVNDIKKLNDIIMLIKLNEQVTRLKWSQSVGDLPDDIVKSLSNIEELKLIDLIKKNPDLKDTLGIGVIRQGNQKDDVFKILKKESGLEKINDAIVNNDNIVLF